MDKSILFPQQTSEVDLYLRLGELFNRLSSSINQRHLNGFFSSCSFHSLHLNIKPYPHLPFPCRVVLNLLCSAGLILFPSYVQNMVYYKISHVDHRISNPEQRIASDIPKFCSELSDLVQDDMAAIAEGLIYIWRLCSYASPKYVLWILVILLWIDCYSL
jgi:hypothetical protein